MATIPTMPTITMPTVPTVDQVVRWYEGWEGLTPDQIRDYAASLYAHVRYVQEAGRQLGVPEGQLAAHDATKWGCQEFPHYAAYFCRDRSAADAGPVNSGFARAWLHHIHHNPHHWQHFIFPDGFAPAGSDVEAGVVEMPPAYALEMVADWMGASKAYTGSWDMSDWLARNLPKLRLHSRTAALVRDVLVANGYGDVVRETKGVRGER